MKRALLLLAVVPVFGQLVGEDVLRVDDTTVRRVRDPSNGVVCYVAQSYAYSTAPRGRTVAIDCLKERP